MLRVGDEPSDSSKAGVFNATTAVESSPSSHGIGTDYCGLVVGNKPTPPIHTTISTGIGTFIWVYDLRAVSPDCLSFSSPEHNEACCDHPSGDKLCPRGWGNRKYHLNYEPGCFAGTYYPNPTPASKTNRHTGSRKCKNHNCPIKVVFPRSRRKDHQHFYRRCRLRYLYSADTLMGRRSYDNPKINKRSFR